MDKSSFKLLFIIFILLNIFQFINPKIKITENKIGEIDGYFYELWKSDYIGLTSLSLENPHSFYCSWNKIDNAVFQLGKKLGYTTFFKNLSDITVNYDVDYNPNGNSYFCINGYLSDFYEEFFIVENWDSWAKPSSAKSLGNISIDDGIYDIYYNEVIYPPNIHGILKKIEYWSVRREKRSQGTVSVEKHFKSWIEKGLNIDIISRISFLIEGFQSSGSAYVNNLEIIINEK